MPNTVFPGWPIWRSVWSYCLLIRRVVPNLANDSESVQSLAETDHHRLHSLRGWSSTLHWQLRAHIRIYLWPTIGLRLPSVPNLRNLGSASQANSSHHCASSAYCSISHGRHFVLCEARVQLPWLWVFELRSTDVNILWEFPQRTVIAATGMRQCKSHVAIVSEVVDQSYSM